MPKYRNGSPIDVMLCDSIKSASASATSERLDVLHLEVGLL